MATWASIADALWQNALTVIPLALAVALVCRYVRCRPATRHTLWLLVLGWFLLPPVLPEFAGLSAALRTIAPVSADAADDATDKTTRASAPALAAGPAPLPTAELSTTSTPRGLFSTADRTSAYRADPRARSRGPSARPEPSVPVSLAPVARSVGPDTPRAPAAPDAFAPLSQETQPVAEACPSTAFLALPPAEVPKPLLRAGDEVQHTDNRAALERLARMLPPADGAEPVAAALESTDRSIEPPPVAGVAENAAPPVPTLARDAYWRAWLAGAFALRDAFVRIPAPPMLLWLSGMAALFGVLAFGVAQFHRRAANPAAPSSAVAALVERTARRLGLRRAPQVLMVSQRISPMIESWWRPRLLLPAELWSQLRAAEQEVILLHELAHLRRRDHVIRWLTLGVLCLFWWHPLAWWVRRRIDEEAELCCDAWVTWLCPEGRRAYAEALLKTRSFLSGGPAQPATALGISTARAKRLARRITMVMTETVRPRLSTSGAVLVVAMLVAGWIAAPALACPKNKQKARTTTAQGGVVNLIAPCGQTAPVPPVPSVPPVPAVAPVPPVSPVPPIPPVPGAAPRALTITTNAAGQSAPAAIVWSADDGCTTAESGSTFAQHMQQRAARSPIAIARTAPSGDIEARLARLEAELARLSETLAAAKAGAHAHGLGVAVGGQAARAAEQAARAAEQANRVATEQAARAAERAWVAASRAPSAQGGPTTPTPADDTIIIRSYKLPPGKLEALVQLMIRDDVPVRVRQTDGEIEVHGTAREHEVFQLFLGIINPSEQGGGGRTPEPMLLGLLSLPAQAELEAKLHGALLRTSAARADLQGMEQAVERLQNSAEKLNEKAAKLHEKAADMGDGAEALSLMERAAAMEAEARDLEAQAEQLEAQMDALESLTEELEDAETDADAEPETPEPPAPAPTPAPRSQATPIFHFDIAPLVSRALLGLTDLVQSNPLDVSVERLIQGAVAPSAATVITR